LNKASYEFPAEFSASVIKDALGKPTGFVTIIKDITERKKMENELRNYSGHLQELITKRTVELEKSQELLVKSERLAAIGQAATMVGHDLRNPLQAIENGIYYLSTELANLPVSEKVKETLQAVHKSIDYADNIVKDLQCFASDRKPVFREIDINELVKDTLLYTKKPENIETTIETSNLPKIEADKDMISRIFVNLAINGIQAMNEKGGTMKVSTKNSDGFIEISFKDTGIGITKENLRRIFTPFFTTKAQGMGVGLAISKRFAELHGGRINVKSKEGEGSVFTVNLPIQRNGGGNT
jgi:signal transduction histidine kinase